MQQDSCSTDPQSLVQLLAEQVSCYQKLLKLTELQHEHVQHARTEELLKILQSRQAVLDQLAAHEQVLGPIKRDWAHVSQTLDSQSRQRAEAMLAETRSVLERITAADRRDVLALQQRKLNLGRQIQGASSARSINRAYAAAAYGKGPSKVNVQR